MRWHFSCIEDVIGHTNRGQSCEQIQCVGGLGKDKGNGVKLDILWCGWVNNHRLCRKAILEREGDLLKKKLLKGNIIYHFATSGLEHPWKLTLHTCMHAVCYSKPECRTQRLINRIGWDELHRRWLYLLTLHVSSLSLIVLFKWMKVINKTYYIKKDRNNII